jgi:hypothetical protein
MEVFDQNVNALTKSLGALEQLQPKLQLDFDNLQPDLGPIAQSLAAPDDLKRGPVARAAARPKQYGRVIRIVSKAINCSTH